LLAMRHPEKVIKLVSTGANLWPDSTAFVHGFWQSEKQHYDTLYNQVWATPKQQNDWKLFMLDWNQPNIALADLKKIKCPSLIICGDHDLISVEHTALIYENISNAYLWVVPNSPHATVKAHADEFNKKADDFFVIPFHVWQ
jgi:pimeloyl-ACP methyl ester carboxylesterase